LPVYSNILNGGERGRIEIALLCTALNRYRVSPSIPYAALRL